jgi:hypothetical protein
MQAKAAQHISSMHKFIFLFFLLGLTLCTHPNLVAQPIITEYIVMPETFQIDLTNKKIQKAIYIKGVLDIEWIEKKLTLAVTYNPRAVEMEEALKLILNASSVPDPVAVNQSARAAFR